MPNPNAVHVDTTLTNFSLQYKNEEMIWDKLMPVVKVGKRSEKYWVLDKGQRFRKPDDALAADAMPNEMKVKRSTDNYSVEDHGQAGWVSREEEDNADTPLSPMMDQTELNLEVLHLAQEIRVASLVFAAATYPVGNKVQLAGTSQWGQSADDPIGAILTGLDAAFFRPNKIVFGAEAWTVFRRLPEVLDAVKGATRSQGAGGGLANRSEVASLFDVDEVLVGRARQNTANEGQADAYARVWGKHCALLYVNPNAGNKTVTFGKTFVESKMMTFRNFDGKRGVKGSTHVKTTWNSDEKITAADVGYLIQDAVA